MEVTIQNSPYFKVVKTDKEDVFELHTSKELKLTAKDQEFDSMVTITPKQRTATVIMKSDGSVESFSIGGMAVIKTESYPGIIYGRNETFPKAERLISKFYVGENITIPADTKLYTIYGNLVNEWELDEENVTFKKADIDIEFKKTEFGYMLTLLEPLTVKAKQTIAIHSGIKTNKPLLLLPKLSHEKGITITESFVNEDTEVYFKFTNHEDIDMTFDEGSELFEVFQLNQ